MVGKADNKVFFNLWSEGRGEFSGKYRAFAATDVTAELHCGHTYRVRFNSNSAYPTIEAIVETIIRDKDEPAPGGSEATT